MKPSVVKVVCNENREALFFSRAPIPWPRAVWGAHSKIEITGTPEPINFLQHVGVYGFRVQWLKKFSEELLPSTLEITEGLEQLRALAAGWKIGVVQATEPPGGIDTQEDLDEANKKITLQTEK